MVGRTFGALLLVTLPVLAGCGDGSTAGPTGSDADGAIGTDVRPDDARDAEGTSPSDAPIEADGEPDDGDAEGEPGSADAAADGDAQQDAAPGSFGTPCTGNEDCFSGWCVQGPEGFICTKQCAEDCPEGWNCRSVQNENDVVFLCLPQVERLCTPCSGDFQCTQGRCLELDGEGRCAPGCDDASDCPDGYVCETPPSAAENAEDEEPETFCQPQSGSCSCTPDQEGAQRTCERSNEHGSCFGVETCAPEEGWIDCNASEPAEETCNGVDDDCNGLADDGLPDSEPCERSNEHGSCEGTRVCAGSEGWVCDAPEPTAESCNGQDDDCDGAVDEDFKAEDGSFTLDAHCGGCFQDCTGAVPNGTGTCGGSPEAPECVVGSCDPGFVPISDTLCAKPPDSTCQSCDGDDQCFGGSCVALGDEGSRCLAPCPEEGSCEEGYSCQTVDGSEHCVPDSGTCTCLPATDGATRSCTVSNEIGTCQGAQTCDASSGWSECSADEPVPESCNGEDDDCNGLVDDDLAEAGSACSVEVEGVGACEGVRTCLGADGWSCKGPQPKTETCNFTDDDCDGAVDEDFKTTPEGADAGVYATFEHCGTCNASCGVGFPNASSTSCQIAEGTARCAVDSCKDGFVKLNPFQCVPESSGLCEQCSQDAGCAGPNAACLELDDGSFCSRSCDGAGDCPDGFACTETDEHGDMCLPTTGSCTCTAENTDLSRTCSKTFTPDDPSEPEYTCNGVEQCTADGWGGCELPDEVCDGLDNDCDGATDEPFRNEAGTYDTLEHCGACNASCFALDVAHAEPTCETGAEGGPSCGYACDEGWVDVNGLASDGCECQPSDGPDFAGDGIDSNCDGIDGEIEAGIFVAKDGSDDAAGNRESPMRTIGAALDRAESEGMRDVYVATGVYGESIRLREGIGVYGGYSSDFEQRDPVLFETAVLGQDPTGDPPGAVNAVDVGSSDDRTVLAGFTVLGASAANVPGADSYAVYVRSPGSNLLIRNNRIVAGAGGAGASGGGGEDGQDGQDGEPGDEVVDVESRSCSNAGDARSGGDGGQRSCGGTNVDGGDGGDARCPAYGDEPTSLEDGDGGSGSDAGAGGDAAWDSRIQTDLDCGLCNAPPDNNPFQSDFGTPGEAGDDGSGGEGCATSSGGIVDGEWDGGSGANGASGSHGSGGGGGGAGSGVEVTGNDCDGGFGGDIGGDDLGGTGGGGGSGGCGGTGGEGGGSGGGSFGLFVLLDGATQLPTVVDNTIQPGRGGDGGAGGPGGSGGQAGAGAPGGSSTEGSQKTWCATGGAEGGNGGRGGHGGGGGGGCGGPSYGIFVDEPGTVSGLGAWTSSNAFEDGGQPGAGGPGGSSLGDSGAAGDDGIGADTNF